MNTENNKIIAEFMGEKLPYKNDKGSWEFYVKDAGLINSPNIEDIDRFLGFNYHSDWNLLMEVVEKIESLDGKKYYVVIKHTQCKFANYYTEETIANVIHTHNKMQSVYLACLDFIKWYIENSAKRN